MTNAELIQKIRAEIERLKSLADQMDYQKKVGFNWALDDLLSFLSTLESEKPINQDELEEEIDRFEDWMETYNQSDYQTSFTTRDIARHFYELGKQSGCSEKPIIQLRF